MANLNLVTHDDFDHSHSFVQDQDQPRLNVSADANLNGLLSDQVVMQWLMDLEAHGLDDDTEASKRHHA